jgi:hypothetical protein
MSIKKLFDDKNRRKSGKILKASSLETLTREVEDVEQIEEAEKKRLEFVPPVDYSKPENFVNYGSAEEYYRNAFNHVANYYPYDGSSREKIKFENELNPFEKYIFDVKYPKSTGFVNLGISYGTTGSAVGGYSTATGGSFIIVKGGPHASPNLNKFGNPKIQDGKANIFKESDLKINNLAFGGPSGSTVEFWFKKKNFTGSVSQREVVLDVWNGEPSASEAYGRFTIELSRSADRFYVTHQSGTKGVFRQGLPLTGGLSLASNEWNHYAFSFLSTSAGTQIDLYKDGEPEGPQIVQGQGIGLVTGSLIAHLGALRTNPSGTSTSITSGMGKLSASLDEFRYWRQVRKSDDIGRNWFAGINGGSNQSENKSKLGVYFKFNEGITEINQIDKVVLDYSGRINNGTFNGYSLGTRSTSSAIMESSASVVEFGDPIIRSSNPILTGSRNTLLSGGITYDYTNTSNLYFSMPTWIIEQDENSGGELKQITQIISSYFDTLHAQITTLTKVKNMGYTSGSTKPFPYGQRLLESLGFEAPELFSNASVLSQILQKDDKRVYESKLYDVKNEIYKNLYNNIVYLYKSKGTHKSFRNLIRCLGIDENIVKVKTYANDQEFELKDEFLPSVSNKRYVDVSGLGRYDDNLGIVYQNYNTGSLGSVGILSGSDIDDTSFTLEGNFILPRRPEPGETLYQALTSATASLFGFHTPDNSSPVSTGRKWAATADDFGLQVYSVHSTTEYSEVISPVQASRDAFFIVEDAAGNRLLSSSVMRNAFDNRNWNIALRLKPTKHPFSEGVAGTSLSGTTATQFSSSYTLELYGVNMLLGEKQSHFSASATLNYATGSNILSSNKMVYAGASRTNFTGSALVKAESKFSSIRFWNSYLDNETINLHAIDVDSYGLKHPFRNVYNFESAPDIYIPAIETLALHWDFSTVSGSDGEGRFRVLDFSSGSAGNKYTEKYQGSLNQNLKIHNARGDFFKVDDKPVKKEYVYSGKLGMIEEIYPQDFVQVLSTDDVQFQRDDTPTRYFFNVEKSIYDSISKEMLEFFASIQDFNNLIGEPVNKYRSDYKDLSKLREIFFRKVENTPDVEKYVDYYKWVDSAINNMLDQLFPASAGIPEAVRNVIESHVLERNKYQYAYTHLKRTEPEPIGTIQGIEEMSYNWRLAHAPPRTGSRNDGPAELAGDGAGSRHEDRNTQWWSKRAERGTGILSSSIMNKASERTPNDTDHLSGALNTRSRIFTTIKRSEDHKGYAKTTLELNRFIRQGSNQLQPKDRSAPTEQILIDRFETIESEDDLILRDEYGHPVGLKRKVPFRAKKNGDLVKGELFTPFTVQSSSVETGYQDSLKKAGINKIGFSGYHEDSDGMGGFEDGMQGPFTRQHVGGRQYRNQLNHLLTAPTRADSEVAAHTIDLTQRREGFSLDLKGNGTASINRIITGSTPKGHFLRGVGNRTVLNIANIKTTASAVIVGNYQNTYEVVQTSDRSINNLDYRKNTANYTSDAAGSPYVAGIVDYLIPTRTVTKGVFVERFSSPGGIETSTPAYLDRETQQFSANNALTFRNISVRNLLNSQLRTHQAFGGFIPGIWGGLSVSGTRVQGKGYRNLPGGVSTAELSLPDHLEYLTTGSQAGSIDESIVSAHKVQRNGVLRFEYGAPNAASSPEIEDLHGVGNRVVYVTGASYDNAFVSRPIPQADRTAWFMNMSGADAAHMAGGSGYATGESLYDTWVRNSSLYPSGGISIPKPSLISGSVNNEYKLDADNPNNLDDGIFNLNHLAGFGTQDGLFAVDRLELNGILLSLPDHGPRIPVNEWRADRATLDDGTDGGMVWITSSVQISREDPSKLVWKWAADIPAFVPWTQLRQGDLHPLSRKRLGARFMNRTQIFRFENQGDDPQAPVVEVREEFRESPVSMNNRPDEMDIVVANFAEANNDPLDTALNTNINQALQRNVFSQQTIRFSEGNIRQGFSNVLLDKKLKRGKNTQTPYTYITKLRKEAPFQQYLNGIYAVSRYKHEETIFPRDKFSALSGTRERANYTYPAWADDEISSEKVISSVYDHAATSPSPLFPMSSSEQHVANLKDNRDAFTVQSPRYKMWSTHPNPSSGSTGEPDTNVARNCFGRTRNFQVTPRLVPAGANEAAKVESIFGRRDLTLTSPNRSGSVWPLDSFMYSNQTIFGDHASYPPIGRLHMTATAIVHTYPAGELMSVPWDPIIFSGSDNDGTFQALKQGNHFTHHTASKHRTIANRTDAGGVANNDYDSYIMPKYVYSVATSAYLSVTADKHPGRGLFQTSGSNPGRLNSDDADGTTSITGSTGPLSMIAYSPGGPTTRPPWTAYNRRYNVKERLFSSPEPALNKYIPKMINETRAPFYGTYSDFKKDVESSGKDYTIIAEYKNSDHVVDRIKNKQDDKFIFAEALFNLTGAAVSASNQEGFISRYMLSDLFQQGEKLLLDDLDSLSRPTDYSIKANTVQKVLPYFGFYPVNRTLQIATLFSQSYTARTDGEDAQVVGSGGSTMSRPRAYQTLIDPLFAPGLLYNSIRFGMAVDHPVRTLNQSKGFAVTGSNKRPLGGVLSASIGVLLGSGSSAIRYKIAEGTKVFPAKPEDIDPSATGYIGDHTEAASRFWYGRRLPFETLLNPKEFINPGNPVVDYHIDATFAQKVTASINVSGTSTDDTPFRSAMGNFLGSVPEFFLENEGVTMVVGKPEDPESITVLSGAMYTGEIVVRQTPNFNIYSNPSACGPATATGSLGWDAIEGFTLATNSKALTHVPFSDDTGDLRSEWPRHRGEFAPHTAPYYYGPSVAKFTYIAPGIDAQGNALRTDEARTVTLKQIIQDCKIEFLNEDSWRYDCDHSGTLMIPPYGWNRAWANRMNLDATLVLNNKHAGIEPQNAWAIGTKWESPILDFPNTAWHDDDGEQVITSAGEGEGFLRRGGGGTVGGTLGSYDFSSSIKLGEFNRVERQSQAPHTYGMWHQYGILPFEGEGVFMELKNIDINDTKTVRLMTNTDQSISGTFSSGSLAGAANPGFTLSGNRLEYRFAQDFANRTQSEEIVGIENGNHNLTGLLASGKNRVSNDGNIQQISKILEKEKKRVKHLDGSLWKLTGFKQEDIGRPMQLGKLAKRKTISEAIVAIPFVSTDGDEFEFITIPPPKQGQNEGPQVARLREKLADYNLPPALERNLSVLIPEDYPFVPDNFDFQGARLPSEKRPFAIYLFEFNMELNQQDIADIWNNVMPRASVTTLAEETSGTVISIDHAIPCSDFTAESVGRIDRRLRDLIDIQNPNVLGATPGLDERVRWMVFKVKKRSVQSYEEMIQNSLIRAGAIEESEAPVLRGPKAYRDRERNFNWPYDFFSMIEMAKITTGVQFRPDVSEIDATGDFTVKQPEIGGGGKKED